MCFPVFLQQSSKDMTKVITPYSVNPPLLPALRCILKCARFSYTQYIPLTIALTDRNKFHDDV